MHRVFRQPSIVLLVVLSIATAAHAQHDYKVSRNLIRKGEYEQALKILTQRITKYPDDSEWVYQQAIARALVHTPLQAQEALTRAHEMGVPTGRVAADARDLLAPIQKTPALRKIFQTQRNRPVQGPMLGDLTHESVRIWIRTAQPAEVGVRIAGVENTPSAKTTAQSDLTAVVQVRGLTPDQDYKYQILIDGKPVKLPQSTHFRTRPAPGDPVKFSFAFGGGAGYVTKHEHMWDTIGAETPDALFLLGDNMYSDDPESLRMQRFCYYRRQSPPQFRKLVARTPVYSIWDDHDFGTNDCSGGPDIDKPAWKIPVWNVFQQNWANPGYGGGPQQPGCWYDFTVGDIHFIMLDGRYYRHRKDNTMLGPVQKAWLKQTLLKNKATFTIIASPVPWEYRTKGDSKDTWNGFKDERAEIFDFLAEQKIEGVLLISADRHRSDAWKIDRPNGYPLYEFNSSRLTNNHVHGEMKAALFSYNKKQSFGLVEFDTTADDPSVKYTVINIDGQRMHSLELKRSELQ